MFSHSGKAIVLIGFLFFSITPIKAASPSDTQFGIFYTIWHCATKDNIHDTTKILMGEQNWGNTAEFHWWGEPELGYYCETDRPEVLETHAKQLRNAGFNFVYVDITNWPVANPSTAVMIQEPFAKMVEVWSQIPNAPKIVPWVIINNTNTNETPMVNYITEQLDKYPNLYLNYEGKPLLLVYNISNNQELINSLKTKYTIRQIEINLETTHPDIWTWIQPCQPIQSFINQRGNTICNQKIAVNSDGTIEQISVSSAYQTTYMSNTETSAGKFDGNTLRAQFGTVMVHPGVPFVTINGWNEWIALRLCSDTNWDGTSNCVAQTLPNGNPLFVDSFNEQYNKDIEPSKSAKSDYYYQLTKSCIALYKSGTTCSSSSSDYLCCQPFSENWRSSLVKLPGDLNGDDQVNIDDYNTLVTDFGSPYTIYDYNQLLTNYGN